MVKNAWYGRPGIGYVSTLVSYRLPLINMYKNMYMYVSLSLLYRSEADTDSVYSGATSDGCSLVSESMSFIAPSEYTNTISLTGSINHYLGYFIPGDNKSEFFFYVYMYMYMYYIHIHIHMYMYSI